MRKSVVATTVAVLLTMTVSHSWAQVTVGARGGLSFSKLGGDVDLDTRTGFAAGVYAEFPLSGQWWLQPEIAFTQKGGKEALLVPVVADTFIADVTTKISYLQLTLPIIIRPPLDSETVFPRVYGGAIVGVEVGCTVDFDGPDVSESSDCERTLETGVAILDPAFTETKSVDLGLVLGAGVDLGRGPGRFSIDARYDFGLTDINDVAPQPGQPEIKINNRAFHILLGYSFRI